MLPSIEALLHHPKHIQLWFHQSKAALKHNHLKADYYQYLQEKHLLKKDNKFMKQIQTKIFNRLKGKSSKYKQNIYQALHVEDIPR